MAVNNGKRIPVGTLKRSASTVSDIQYMRRRDCMSMIGVEKYSMDSNLIESNSRNSLASNFELPVGAFDLFLQSQKGVPNDSFINKKVSQYHIPSVYNSNCDTNIVRNTITSDQINIKEEINLESGHPVVATSSSPYPSIDVSNGINSSSSKPASPLVVLPLPTDITSSESGESSFRAFSMNERHVNNMFCPSKFQQPPKHQSRVNELAEYAKHYEDLYSRRMGGMNCSSTSGSIQSATGLAFYRNQISAAGKVTSLEGAKVEKKSDDLRSEFIRTPMTSLCNESPIPTELGTAYAYDYDNNYSKNHQNIVQWVQSHQNFNQGGHAISGEERPNYSQVENMANGHVNDNIKAENSNYDTGKVESRHHPDDVGEKNTETNGVLKVKKRGDPNKSGLPDVDLVKRPGVKSLVSAFNEQIESHKVLKDI